MRWTNIWAHKLFVKWVPHDDVIKWKHFPRYWPFVRGIHRSPVNSPRKSQWRGALMLSLICVWINGWVNNREAGDLRSYRAAHYDIIVMRCYGMSSGCSSVRPTSWMGLGQVTLTQCLAEWPKLLNYSCTICISTRCLPYSWGWI